MDNDQFGRTVSLTTVGPLDIYDVGSGLFELKFLTGTPLDQVYKSINAMTPPDYYEPPIQPVTKYKGYTMISSHMDNPELLMPVDSLTGAQGIYRVGAQEIDVYLNGQELNATVDYDEVGAAGSYSDQIQFNIDLEDGDVIEFQRK